VAHTDQWCPMQLRAEESRRSCNFFTAQLGISQDIVTNA
jgi:hypothetical protein